MARRRLPTYLKTMRKINLIHGDIKPENILWSKNYAQMVLVDFGLAKFVRQNLNEKTETYFRGTKTHVGEQMLELYHYSKDKHGYVNLFKNDF